jgi:hypothetical protein
MVAAAAKRSDEATFKTQIGVKHWIDDLPWPAANERLLSQPTVNIEGLVGGYTGPGGKTILPHRAAAKLDLRLVPDMKFAGRRRRIEGPPREAWLRRHRGQRHRRLRPDEHPGERPADPGADRGA